MADRAHSTSRRALLAGLATSAVLTAPTLAGELHPDAELVALGREFDAAWAAEQEAFASRDEVREDAAYEATRDVVNRIEAVVAASVAGLIVKARACSWCHDGEPFTPESFNQEASTDLRLAAGVIRDLLAIGCVA